MKTLHVKTEKEYDILIGSGLLDTFAERLPGICSGKNIALVSDRNVFPLYADIIKEKLIDKGYHFTNIILPAGEQSKDFSYYKAILEQMCKEYYTRGDAVVALGGGVPGDLAGFVAATYQRGITFIQVPTSLLAAVDSSVGGKTAINLDTLKNQVGAFYQPSLVLCDTDTLSTLPQEEYTNGCAEIIKYAMLDGEELFGLLEKTPVSENYEEIIYRCVDIKRRIVEEDEFESGKRMLLNFGHTIGHTIESLSGYGIRHGEGVAIGMSIITKAAAEMGICDKSVAERLDNLLEKYGLPVSALYPADSIFAAALSDKKNTNSKMRLIVPEKIGSCVIKEIPREDFISWLNAGGVK